MGKIFRTKLDAACIVLIPTCIGINYLGKLFASLLKLPLWLDSIGTCIGGVLGGPIIGGICGAANNLIYGFTTGDNITLVYALTSLCIGLAVGVMARLGFMTSLPKSLLTACVAGFAAVIISTPLNVIFWGGTTGNVWGDALFAVTQSADMPVLLGSFLDEVVVDVPDKLITLIIVYLIIKGLPKKLTALYEAEDEVEILN
jgi:energy-coupling factor transport system substrate-specific component